MLIVWLALLFALTIVGGLVGGLLLQLSCVVINRIVGAQGAATKSGSPSVPSQYFSVRENGPFAPPGTVARPVMTSTGAIPFPGFHRAFGIVSGTILVHGGTALFFAILLTALSGGYPQEEGIRFFHTLVYIAFPVCLAIAARIGLGTNWRYSIAIAATFSLLVAFLYGAVLGTYKLIQPV